MSCHKTPIIIKFISTVVSMRRQAQWTVLQRWQTTESFISKEDHDKNKSSRIQTIQWWTVTMCMGNERWAEKLAGYDRYFERDEHQSAKKKWAGERVYPKFIWSDIYHTKKFSTSRSKTFWGLSSKKSLKIVGNFVAFYSFAQKKEQK